MKIKIKSGLFLILCAIGLYILSDKISSFCEELFYPDEKKLFSVTELLDGDELTEAEKILSGLVIKDGVNSKTRALALYNLSHLHLFKAAKGDKSAAKEAFFCLKESLRLNPQLLHPKFNLELLLRNGEDQKSGRRSEERVRPKGGKTSPKNKTEKESSSLPGLPPESLGLI